MFTQVNLEIDIDEIKQEIIVKLIKIELDLKFCLIQSRKVPQDSKSNRLKMKLKSFG